MSQDAETQLSEGESTPPAAAGSHAFMAMARLFADPAPALSLTIAAMEEVPHLDPELPLLTFDLFSAMPEVPAGAGELASPAQRAGRLPVFGRLERDRPSEASPSFSWLEPESDRHSRTSPSVGTRDDPSVFPLPSSDHSTGERVPSFSRRLGGDASRGRATHHGMDGNRRHQVGFSSPVAVRDGPGTPTASDHDAGAARSPRATTPVKSMNVEEHVAAPITMPWLAGPGSPPRNRPSADSPPDFAAEALMLVDRLADAVLTRPGDEGRPAWAVSPSPQGPPSSGETIGRADAEFRPFPPMTNHDLTPHDHVTPSHFSATRHPSDDTDQPSLTAEELAAQVAGILYEQARRHGVDLS